MTGVTTFTDEQRALLVEGLDALAYWQMREEDTDPATERRDGWTLYGPGDADRYGPLVELAETLRAPGLQVTAKLPRGGPGR